LKKYSGVPSALEQTIDRCLKRNLKYHLLDVLADEDEEEDLKHMKSLLV